LKNELEPIEDEGAIVAPVAAIIDGKEIARAGRVSLFNLPEKMFGMESDLIFRSPEVRKPKTEEEGDDCPRDEAVFEGREHNLSIGVKVSSVGPTIDLTD
jgi:hypothetical protein